MRKTPLIGLLVFVFLIGIPLSSFKTISNLPKIESKDDLAKKLSENINFENFILKSIEFEKKIYKSHSSALLRKIIEKKATEQETSVFANNLGYSSFEDIKNVLLELSSLSNKYKKQFPEINEVKDVKALLIQAARNVISKSDNKLKFGASYLPIEEEECWASFGVLLTLCWNLYYAPGDYNGYLICLGIADAWLIGCLAGAN